MSIGRRHSVLALRIGLACLIASSAAYAEIYRWTDAQGRIHFTQQLDQVPPSQRAAARSAAKTPSSGSLQTYAEPAKATSKARTRRARRRADEGLQIRFQRDGSLMRVNVKLNDLVTAPFYIDTGASGISIPSHVAEQLGFRVRQDTPHTQVVTAGGVVSRAVMKLRAVELDGARVENLEATVNPAMQIGLLGGTFFNNFVYRVDAAASLIELRPNENIRGGLGKRQWRQRFQDLLDPIAELETHLEEAEIDDDQERAYLENRAIQLQAALDELVLQANRMDVPYSWRH